MTTNLGTAYVSVMPSMKGFGKAVEDGMSGIDTTSAGKAMGTRAASGFAGGMASQGLVIGAASALASRAFDAVASSTDRAIRRVDTMANFPKVMSNLKISGEAASSAINKISEGLDGLPTALDEGVAAVQRFTSYNNDVDKSADMFLAVNDAILAGGSGAQMQASALEQLSQAYTKGKMDTMEWRTLQQAMPAQLKQVAEAMGVTTEQLGAGLRQAEKDANYLRDISMDEFINEIMRLDKEGVNGFASFEEQARTSTTGIGTAMANLENRIAKGVATIIDAVGQENISGAINTLSSGIGGVAKDLAVGVKDATEFVKEHEQALKWLVDTVYEVAPAAIQAWGAFKVFQGGKALFSGITGEVGLLMGKLVGLEGAAGAAGGALGAVSLGATGLVAGIGVGIGALYLYNEYLTDMRAEAMRLTPEQQAVVDHVNTLSDAYKNAVSSRDKQVESLNKEHENLQELVNEYNNLIDANGNVIEGNEARADEILGSLAEALGVEKENIYDLIDSYGKLGDAAQDSLQKRHAEKILEADAEAYGEAIKNQDEYAKSLADSQRVSEEAAEKSSQAWANYADTQQDVLDAVSATPEAIGVAAIQTEQLAKNSDVAGEEAIKAADAYKTASETYTDAATLIANHEGLEQAISEGDVATIEDRTLRLTNSIQSAETGTEESLRNQVNTFRERYEGIKEASESGTAGLEGSLERARSALAIAEGEYAKYNGTKLDEKFASITVNDGQLVDVQGKIYTWNGTNLIDQDGNIVVDEVELVDAQEHVHTWNGTDLDLKFTSVSVDSSAVTSFQSSWSSYQPETKTAYINVVKKGETGDAAGGFFSLHASGGFITNGPIMLGKDAKGIGHIAGEDGHEWVMKHADGTTSIVPIENKKYLTPYAKTIASMIGGGRSVNVTVNLNYKAGDDASKMARDISRRLTAYMNMEA